jgi:hypothetical protein
LAVSAFIRPELRAALWRWRDILIGVALMVFGVWAMVWPGGLLGAIGGFVALTGFGVALTGLQRWRFRAPRDGPGTVDVDEGQVTYFGPLTGGAVALREVTELALVRAGQTPHWRLSAGEEHLFIPVDADGADALFDAFTTLPGLKVQSMLSALEDGSDTDIVIWTRAEAPPHRVLE